MWSRQSVEDLTLKVLYGGCAFLCGLMVVVILVFPSSLYQGTIPGREGKYSAHPLVRLTHQLPGAVWAFAIIFQLHPGFRKSHREWHRRAGYACLSSAAIMMFGFVLIEVRKLDYMHQDYSHVPLDEAWSDIGMDWINPLLFLRGVAVLFIAAAGLALAAILRRDIVSHRKWILRHVGFGIWIATQRLYIGVAMFFWARTDEQKKAAFGDGVYTIAITALSAELAIWIYHCQQQRQEQEEKEALAAPETQMKSGQALGS